MAQLRESIPFAVCGANAMVEVAGKKVTVTVVMFGTVVTVLTVLTVVTVTVAVHYCDR